MAGLNLNTAVSARVSGSPMTPPSARPSTSSTIAQQAYGISGTGVSTGDGTPGIGAVGAGVIAVAVLVYMWWSLPR